jgi:NAD(P)-dependent dehydrogenase (short-subunit alcohol dehydrogenase family)
MHLDQKSTDLTGATALVTGGTDGIGAATALELVRRGANVVIIGRSAEKADKWLAKAASAGAQGSWHAITADLSSMRNVIATVAKIEAKVQHLTFVLQSIGVLIPRASFTDEKIERCFATSYLSRFLLTERLLESGRISKETRLISVAASSPKVPSFAKVEFGDLATVESRTGMKGHGQSQLANDVFVEELVRRYGLTAIGYGPGSVDTGIRRELPKLLTTLMAPFFKTRSAEVVARELVGLFLDQNLQRGHAHFFTKGARFDPDPFITDSERGNQLWAVSQALVKKALGSLP